METALHWRVVWYYGYGMKDFKVCPPWCPIAARGLLQLFVRIGGHIMPSQSPGMVSGY